MRLYPELPHWNFGCRMCYWYRVWFRAGRDTLIEPQIVSLWLSASPCKGWGVTESQLDLPSLTPLSVAASGWPQLGIFYSVPLLKVVNNWPDAQTVLFFTTICQWVSNYAPTKKQKMSVCVITHFTFEQ